MELPSFLTRTQFGDIVLTGHRLGLYPVVRSVQEGASAEQIVEEFPALPLALVHQVIAFYLNH